LICSFFPHCEDALEVELQFCLEGLELALAGSQLPIIIDTDCRQLVSAVHASTSGRSFYLHTISEI
jgi:hypothetical protein